MATRETRADRGRKRGRSIAVRLIGEAIVARQSAGLSQRSLARLLGCSQAEVSRIERLKTIERVSLVDIAAIAAVLGLELGAHLYPAGVPIRDSGHQALLGRFRATLAEIWLAEAEQLLPGPGEARAWDLVLSVRGCVVGVEAETRVRDVQAFVRRIRERERDGGVAVIVIVLAESAHNRRVLPELLEALGPAYATSPRRVLNALREGRALSGSGLILV